MSGGWLIIVLLSAFAPSTAAMSRDRADCSEARDAFLLKSLKQPAHQRKLVLAIAREVQKTVINYRKLYLMRLRIRGKIYSIDTHAKLTNNDIERMFDAEWERRTAVLKE